MPIMRNHHMRSAAPSACAGRTQTEKSTYFNGGLFAGISLSIRFNRLILFRVLACFFIGLYKIFLSYLLLSCQGLILSTHAVCHYLLPFLSDSLVVCCLSSYVPFLVALSLFLLFLSTLLSFSCLSPLLVLSIVHVVILFLT